MNKIFFFLIFFTFSACADNAKKDPFNDFECKKMVSQVNDKFEDARVCESVSDCEVYSGGCPFGCGIPVNSKMLEENKIKQMIEEYNNICYACKFKCQAKKPVLKCLLHKCTLIQAADKP